MNIFEALQKLFGTRVRPPKKKSRATTWKHPDGSRRGKWVWIGTSKYEPHQGARECQRRREGGFAGSGGK